VKRETRNVKREKYKISQNIGLNWWRELALFQVMN